VFANPAGTGYAGSFSAGGVSLSWTANFRGTPRITEYAFIPATFVAGQYVLFFVGVADADGVGYGMNTYNGNAYTNSEGGTIVGSYQAKIWGFTAAAGTNLGTFYLSGVGTVQASYTI
jgi:hypothetical protein